MCFVNFTAKLLQGDRELLGLLRFNPFPEHPPKYVRAMLYHYRFSTPEERGKTGAWWQRELAGPCSFLSCRWILRPIGIC